MFTQISCAHRSVGEHACAQARNLLACANIELGEMAAIEGLSIPGMSLVNTVHRKLFDDPDQGGF